ncbi:MAG: four helix bundle suffix domain-containing protein [Opitutaceae bacterium]|jgi:four helix bundle suffix protein|nr:four helix bundle suffix domain-containing protein [Opitutaceae bacterium]
MDKIDGTDRFIPKHGGYRTLLSFQLAELVYDTTTRFCEKYIAKNSRTRDQMVQAARSGVQNIAEGSVASGTSKETEIKLTNVARASLEELLRDYEDYLRQHRLPLWENNAPQTAAIIAARIKTADALAQWIQTHAETARFPEYSANAARVLCRVAMSLLKKQLNTLEAAFLKEGGLRERMTRARLTARARQR